MRVVCNLQELLEQHGVSPAQFAAQTGIDPRALDNLLEDKKWRLDRANFEQLMLYAFNQGWGPIFTIEQHPIWHTFEENHARIYRGTAQWDAQIEHELSQFLRHIACSPQTSTAPKPEAIARDLREQNCIFVGSPKKNPATEIALCELVGADPFDGSAANRRKLPVQIIGVDPPSGMSSAVLVPSRTEHGFKIGKEFIEVHWLPQHQYDLWHGEADDAAVVIVCRAPLGTTHAVTTIFNLGYSGLATQSVARQLMHGDPPLDAEDLTEPGQLHTFAYRFQFKKPSRRGSRSKTDLRREIADTGVWWPDQEDETEEER